MRALHDSDVPHTVGAARCFRLHPNVLYIFISRKHPPPTTKYILIGHKNDLRTQKIDLETKIKPFIPDYIPAVGEVDAFLKMPKPDGQKEDLGIAVLDEPCLNSEDKTVLELKYVQSKNVARAAPMNVDSIDNADKKPREVSRWISSV